MKEEDKKLCEEYPFLIVRNRWSGKVMENCNHTELDSLPIGWGKRFGLQLCKELKEALGEYLDKYRIYQIKEKFGGLRWYDGGNTDEGQKVVDKYSAMSYDICIECGNDAKYISRGWISPFCEKCVEEHISNGDKTSLDDYSEIKKEA